jgi:hypothetical protein
MRKILKISIILISFFVLILYAEPKDGNRYSIYIEDDNHDTTLPKSFRSWYYREFRGIPANVEIKINVYGDGWRGDDFVIPVYSYYGRKWHRFDHDDILELFSKDPHLYNYRITKKFKKDFVTIARYYPYDTTRISKLEKRFSFKPYFRAKQIGQTGMGRPLRMFMITDFSIPNNQKKAIWIHARTHPSETGSSYVLEGIMEYILKKKNLDDIKINLKQIVFYIVPMLNFDGIVESNARVTPYTSIDLERQWLFHSQINKRKISDSAAIEVRVLNNTINRLIDEGNHFILAINLHSTNSTEAMYPFIFTNFSRQIEEHGATGDSMFIYHLRYANLINHYLCGGHLNVRTSYHPSKPMNLKPYPESWWWVNFKEKVVAFTLESTYRRPGCYSKIVSYKDQLQLGEAIAKAIQKYFELYEQHNYQKELKPYDLEYQKQFFIEPGN